MELKHLLVVVFLLVIVGFSSGGIFSGNTTPAENCPKDVPQPPATVSEETAKSFAETAEAARAYNKVCTYRSFGLGETTAGKRLAIEMRTDEGFYVFAQQPYYYSTRDVEADGATSGVYFVGNDTSVRVSHYGADQRWPDSYAARDSSENVQGGQEIRLYNFDAETHPLHVTLRYENDSATELAYNQSHSIVGVSGVRLLDVATREGTYTLSVVGRSGQQVTYSFTLTDEYPFAIAVYVSPDGEVGVSQTGSAR